MKTAVILLILLTLFSPNLKQTLIGHLNMVECVTFGSDGATLASGSWDQTVRLWEVATGKHKVTFTGHTGMIMSVPFSADGKTLASG